VGIVTFAVWALSPLGGQSALRLLAVTHLPINSTLEVSYYQAGDPEASYLASAGTMRYQAAITANFGAASISSEPVHTISLLICRSYCMRRSYALRPAACLAAG
jgi:hypothetical protein